MHVIGKLGDIVGKARASYRLGFSNSMNVTSVFEKNLVGKRYLRQPDQGSIAPLGIGFAAISLTLVFVILASSSLYIFQKRLKNYSEGVALYVAATGDSAQSYLLRVGAEEFIDFKVQTSLLSDDQTVQATSCARWDFPISIWISNGSRQICAQAAARLE